MVRLLNHNLEPWQVRSSTDSQEQFNLPPEVVQHGVQSLSFLLLECSRLHLSELDFVDSLLVVGLPQETNDSLKDHYLHNLPELRQILMVWTLYVFGIIGATFGHSCTSQLTVRAWLLPCPTTRTWSGVLTCN